MLNASELVGSHDIVFITLDTLRFDVAQQALQQRRLTVLGEHIGQWEARHTPGSFTYAAHAAFFAGFLPTPARPGPHERLFALAFPGSETTGARTAVLEGSSIVEGLAARGYHTLCVGGVGFFNQLTPLGRVFPSMFARALWEPRFGVTDPRSTEHQVAAALSALKPGPTLLFLNISALHQPNCGYLPGASEDSPASMLEALVYADGALAPLVAAFRARRPSLWIVCSDHGTAYGEDGYQGHRIGHPVVYTVPYAEFVLETS